MMFYTSKLIEDVAEKQKQALTQSQAFSDPIQHAVMLADHFEKIQAEEYIIPETSMSMKRDPAENLQQFCAAQYSPF